MYCACFFLFFQGPSTDILQTFPHDVALSKKKRCYVGFLKVLPDKNEGRKPEIFAKFHVQPQDIKRRHS